jgi:hypothetical protein
MYPEVPHIGNDKMGSTCLRRENPNAPVWVYNKTIVLNDPFSWKFDFERIDRQQEKQILRPN